MENRRQELRKAEYREDSDSIIAIFLRWIFGIHLYTKWSPGYFHQTGYSGLQTSYKHDIAIIEMESGKIITVPNSHNYYRFL